MTRSGGRNPVPAVLMGEPHLRQDAGQPLWLVPRRVAGDGQQGRDEHEANHERVKCHGDGQDHPISLGASGPDSANVKNTAIMTTVADTTTRPDVRTEPTRECSGSAWVSCRSFAAVSRNRVRSIATPNTIAPKNSGPQASTNPCGGKFSSPARCPSWKISPRPPRYPEHHRTEDQRPPGVDDPLRG